MSTVERFALIYSDGSFGVCADGWPEKNARDEALGVDAHETRSEHLTRIARVRVEVLEDLGCPAAERIGKQGCPACGGKH